MTPFAAYYFLNQANPQGYPDIVLADLHEYGLLPQGTSTASLRTTSATVFEIDAPIPADLQESEERSFQQQVCQLP
jgi:hypothetical protein